MLYKRSGTSDLLVKQKHTQKQGTRKLKFLCLFSLLINMKLAKVYTAF